MICDGVTFLEIVKKESEDEGADRRTLPPMHGLSGAAAPSMSSLYLWLSLSSAEVCTSHSDSSSHALQLQKMGEKTILNTKYESNLEEKVLRIFLLKMLP